MKELEKLLNQLGLPPWGIAIVLILAAILVYFAKNHIKRRDEKAKKKYEVLHEYAALQEEALTQAFRMLYDEVNLKALTQTEFERVVSQADDLIREPFTKYRAYLNSQVKSKFYDIHNVIAQFRPDPSFHNEPSQEAIDNLIGYRDRFFTDTYALKESILKSI